MSISTLTYINTLCLWPDRFSLTPVITFNDSKWFWTIVGRTWQFSSLTWIKNINGYNSSLGKYIYSMNHNPQLKNYNNWLSASFYVCIHTYLLHTQALLIFSEMHHLFLQNSEKMVHLCHLKSEIRGVFKVLGARMRYICIWKWSCSGSTVVGA